MTVVRQRWALAALVGGALVCATVAAPAATADAPAPVPRLDLTRYLGAWNQLAAVPQVFNLACARDTRANYELDANGDVAVRNTCTGWDGSAIVIKGTARIADPVTGAQLRVSFPTSPMSSPDGPVNYIVTALGPDYSWALVTNPSRTSGFVLARDTELDAAQWDRVRAAITAAGENPCFYLTSPVTGGRSDILPLCTA